MPNVVLYTFAGAVSSLAVGSLLGLAGSWLLPAHVVPVGSVALVAVAVLASCRELGWIPLPLPQPLRQTNDRWVKTLGPRPAAVLWGLDLGTVVSTRFTFAGIWVLVLLPFLTADPVLGGLAFLTYWIGRAVSVWIAPLLIVERTSVLDLMDAISARRRAFRSSHVVGLVLLIGFVGWATVAQL